MLSGILNSRVSCRAFGIAAKLCLGYRCNRKVKFYRAEFRNEAPKSRLYKILKPRFYTLKFYARRSFKFRFGGCEPCDVAPNTHCLKFYDRAAEFLRDKALKFYRNTAGKIRIAEEFSKSVKFHRTKFHYVVKFNHAKFYLVSKFYHYAEFKRLQYFKASPSPYARSGFCK